MPRVRFSQASSSERPTSEAAGMSPVECPSVGVTLLGERANEPIGGAVLAIAPKKMESPRQYQARPDFRGAVLEKSGWGMATAVPNRRAGNARPGATAPPSTAASGKSYQDPALAIHREAVLLQRFYVGANARPPNPVPPPPAETVYNRGTAQYEPLAYHNNGLPRPCRAGSGAPSYSTRRKPRPQASAVPPPVAGAHTAVPGC